MDKIVIIEAFGKTFDRHMSIVARNLRKIDRDEILGLSGDDPNKAIARSWSESTRKWIMIKEVIVTKSESLFVPIAVFGVVAIPDNESVGAPWFVATDDINQAKRFLAESSRKYVQQMKEGFTYLVNFISKENIIACNWLQSCGFIIEEEEMPKKGYHRFYMECGNHV